MNWKVIVTTLDARSSVSYHTCDIALVTALCMLLHTTSGIETITIITMEV